MAASGARKEGIYHLSEEFRASLFSYDEVCHPLTNNTKINSMRCLFLIQKNIQFLSIMVSQEVNLRGFRVSTNPRGDSLTYDVLDSSRRNPTLDEQIQYISGKDPGIL